jgi:hypothetical protein
MEIMKKNQSNRRDSNRVGSARSLMLKMAVAAAVGAVAMLAPATFAQQRVGGDGRLNEANNLVGSGGLNDNSASALPPGVFGNAIVSGDVTGGRGFQGNVPYFAPGAFHGILPGSFVDNFVSGSTNVQTNGTVVNNAQDVHLFLGDNRGVNPPSNFISTGAQPGYIPNTALSGDQFTSDTRLGSSIATSSVGSVVPSAIFQTGGTQAGGPQSAYVTASSLFGVKTLQTTQQNDGNSPYASSSLNNQALTGALGTGDRVDLSSDLRSTSLTQNNPDMNSLASAGLSGLPAGVASYATPQASSPNGLNPADALNPANGLNGSSNAATGGKSASQNPNTPGGNSNSAAANANGQSQNGAGGLNGGPIDSSVGAQVNAAVPSGYALNSTVGGSSLSDSIIRGEDSSTNIFSPTSNQPGSAYQRMVQRLKTIDPNAPLTAVEKNLLYQAKMQDIKKAQSTATGQPGESRALPSNDQPAKARAGGLSGGSGLGTGSSLTGQPNPIGGAAGDLPKGSSVPQQGGAPAPAGDKNKPVFINSFSSDAASPLVKEHLSKAEDLMKQGKFTSALEEYDLVEQQAPSNPFIQLGRANAELGASYYGLAEAHLRQAFMSDQALLSMQLDLKTFLGDDKLQYLGKDLKQIAQANPTESRPVFLLAYICYNTGQPRGAAAYLDLAEKREGKPDPFFKLVRQNWDLPSVSDEKTDTDLNK